MLHEMLKIWFTWVDQWGYLGVFILMAMESSIIPVPSEVVLPPAAFWAAQGSGHGNMTLTGIILAGTAGSYFGSVVSYWASYWIGRPMIQKFGKYVLITPEKVTQSETWINRFGATGIFLARLLPGLRHLISIPAGLLKMRFLSFSLSTISGAAIWCAVLSWFGQEVLGSAPELLESPEAMIHMIKAKLMWFVVAILGLAVLYLLVIRVQPKKLTA